MSTAAFQHNTNIYLSASAEQDEPNMHLIYTALTVQETKGKNKATQFIPLGDFFPHYLIWCETMPSSILSIIFWCHFCALLHFNPKLFYRAHIGGFHSVSSRVFQHNWFLLFYIQLSSFRQQKLALSSAFTKSVFYFSDLWMCNSFIASKYLLTP